MTALFATTILVLALLMAPAAEAQIGTVVDANGQVVGQTLGATNWTAQVVRVTAALAYWFMATPAALHGTTDVVRFESSDCSGQPYIDDLGPAFALVAFLHPSHIVYVPDLASGFRTITAQSVLRENNTCASHIPSPVAAAPAIQVDDLSSFTPPFQLLLQ